MWCFFPINFLQEVEPEAIASIKVVDGNNGNQFEITDRDDVSKIVGGIQQVTFRKKEIASVPGHWYQLDFLNENGETVASLAIQNYRAVRKELSTNTSIFFYCDEEMREIGDYLQQMEGTYFPDYNRDPDFPYEDTGD